MRPTKEEVDAAMAEVWDKYEATDWPNEESSEPSTEQILEAEVRALRATIERVEALTRDVDAKYELLDDNSCDDHRGTFRLFLALDDVRAALRGPHD